MKQILKTCKNVLITGGAGFIGGELIIYLLKNTSVKIFNLDKISYASNKQRIEQFLKDYEHISPQLQTIIKGSKTSYQILLMKEYEKLKKKKYTTITWKVEIEN